MVYPLIHLLHCQKKSLRLCVLQLFMCPSVSSSNYTENKFYTFFLIQAGEFHRLFLDLSLGWKGDLCLEVSWKKPLWSFSTQIPLFSGEYSPNPLLFFRQLTLSLQSIWDSQMLKCNLSGILWPVPKKLHPRGRSPIFSTWTSTSELGMEIIMIPKSTIGTLLS